MDFRYEDAIYIVSWDLLISLKLLQQKSHVADCGANSFMTADVNALHQHGSVHFISPQSMCNSVVSSFLLGKARLLASSSFHALLCWGVCLRNYWIERASSSVIQNNARIPPRIVPAGTRTNWPASATATAHVWLYILSTSRYERRSCSVFFAFLWFLVRLNCPQVLLVVCNSCEALLFSELQFSCVKFRRHLSSCELIVPGSCLSLTELIFFSFCSWGMFCFSHPLSSLPLSSSHRLQILCSQLRLCNLYGPSKEMDSCSYYSVGF